MLCQLCLLEGTSNAKNCLFGIPWTKNADLVGGLEHVLPFHVLGSSSSQLTFIFFRGVKALTSYHLSQLSQSDLRNHSFIRWLPTERQHRSLWGRQRGPRRNTKEQGPQSEMAWKKIWQNAICNFIAWYGIWWDGWKVTGIYMMWLDFMCFNWHMH